MFPESSRPAPRAHPAPGEDVDAWVFPNDGSAVRVTQTRYRARMWVQVWCLEKWRSRARRAQGAGVEKVLWHVGSVLWDVGGELWQMWGAASACGNRLRQVGGGAPHVGGDALRVEAGLRMSEGTLC